MIKRLSPAVLACEVMMPAVQMIMTLILPVLSPETTQMIRYIGGGGILGRASLVLPHLMYFAVYFRGADITGYVAW